MEAALDTLLLKITQAQSFNRFQALYLDESLELLEEIFGDEELTIEDWEI